MQKPSYRFTAAICGIVALLSLWNALTFFYSAKVTGEPGGDRYGVLVQQARLQVLTASLPAVDVVGYLTEPDAVLSVDTTKFLGAESALAPRILVRQSEFPQRWIIGDFSGGIDLATFANKHGFRVAGDFGDGLVLFERDHSR